MFMWYLLNHLFITFLNQHAYIFWYFIIFPNSLYSHLPSFFLFPYDMLMVPEEIISFLAEGFFKTVVKYTQIYHLNHF